MSSTPNATALMKTIPKDIVMAFPRMVARAGSFAFVTVPERIDSMLGYGHSGSVIAEATGNRSRHIVSAALSAGSTSGIAAPTAAGEAASTTRPMAAFSALNFMQAIVLNRTQIYSALRRHVTLTWPLRLALRITPILLFLHHAMTLLQAMRCQSSPKFSFLKYGNADKHIDLDFSGDGGLLYYISSTLLFWETDADSCLAVELIPSRSEVWDQKGSLSLLWPLFQSLCLGQFVETISSAIQGRPLMTETGMSIFEHSLAFAEAEAMISNRLGFMFFNSPKTSSSANTMASSEDSSIKRLFSKSEILDKMNTSPEILLMGVISSLNNLSSQILGVLNMQAKFRLLNTGIWGLCFMSVFVWGFFGMGSESGAESIILRFPTVCIIGFIPHLLILVGIMLCAIIYSLALLLCFLSPPTDRSQQQSIAERFMAAYENMQANAQLTNIHLDMHEDFYTALLKIGFTALTVATEAVYLNEGQRVSVAQCTWLEEERMKEIEAFDESHDSSRRLGIRWEASTAEHATTSGSPRLSQSGYDRLTDVKAVRMGERTGDPRLGADGIGHMQRGGRWLVVASFFRGIFWLSLNWLKIATSKMLDKAGIERRPQWLKISKGGEAFQKNKGAAEKKIAQPDSLDFWILSEDGILESPKNNDIDVAEEMKRRQQLGVETWGEEQELQLDATTYDWWRHGGWWGDRDDSGSYQASIRDDDTTSIVSMSTQASEASGYESPTDVASGASTPTQRHYRDRNRSPSPYASTNKSIDPYALDPHHLASLLDPKTPDRRSEARMLAHHLTAPKTTTRSQYRHAQSFASAKLLTSTRHRPTNSSVKATGALSPDEEAQLLEQLIIARRSRRPAPSDQATDDWRDGAAGMGQGGPQCVVCQTSPRTVLAWPCRCLSLCEECRVSLAMNNFATCVCCRQEVVGFSRLYVP